MEIQKRPDFTSKLVRELAFGTPKFYIAPYDKINHGLVNMSSNCDVKSGLRIDRELLCAILKFETLKTIISDSMDEQAGLGLGFAIIV